VVGWCSTPEPDSLEAWQHSPTLAILTPRPQPLQVDLTSDFYFDEMLLMEMVMLLYHCVNWNFQSSGNNTVFDKRFDLDRLVLVGFSVVLIVPSLPPDPSSTVAIIPSI